MTVPFADELALEDAEAIRYLRLEIEAMAAADSLTRAVDRLAWLAAELSRTGNRELIEWAECLNRYLGEIGPLPSAAGDLETIAHRLSHLAPRSPFRKDREAPPA